MKEQNSIVKIYNKSTVASISYFLYVNTFAWMI